jgi:hypothetical protein
MASDSPLAVEPLPPEVPRNALLDDSLMVAMRAARKHHLEWWLTELERHRGCRSFRPWTCVQSLEYGFTCGCDGVQRHYAIRVSGLKEMLPEARASVLRMWSRPPDPRSPRLAHVRDGSEDLSTSLLFRHLTREQKWHLRAYGTIEVGACGLTFSIRHGGHNNISVKWRGHDLSLCVEPKGVSLPPSDVVLQQKVLLESSPELVLDVAHVHDKTAGLFYESGRFLRDGSDPVVKPVGRVLQVDTIRAEVLDEPVEYMREQMQDLTVVRVVSEVVQLLHVETRTGDFP